MAERRRFTFLAMPCGSFIHPNAAKKKNPVRVKNVDQSSPPLISHSLPILGPSTLFHVRHLPGNRFQFAAAAASDSHLQNVKEVLLFHRFVPAQVHYGYTLIPWSAKSPSACGPEAGLPRFSDLLSGDHVINPQFIHHSLFFPSRHPALSLSPLAKLSCATEANLDFIHSSPLLSSQGASPPRPPPLACFVSLHSGILPDH